MRQITDETIGPKTRQRMIDMRAHSMMRDNAQLPAEVAMDLSSNMQTAYEIYIKQDDNMEAAGNTFDLLREIALSYEPNDSRHLDTDHSEECSCPF